MIIVVINPSINLLMNFLKLNSRPPCTYQSINQSMPLDNLLGKHTLTEAFKWVLALQFLELSRRKLVQKLVDREVAAAHTNLDLTALFYAHVDSLGAELVDALRLSHEHDLELVPIGVAVDVLGHFLIDRIVLHGHVHGDAGLEIDDVVFERDVFEFEISDPTEQVERLLVGLEDPVFQLVHVPGAVLEGLVDLRTVLM